MKIKLDLFRNIKNSFSFLNPSHYKLIEKTDYNFLVTEHNVMNKEYDRNNINDNSRPSLPIPYIDTATGSKIPMWQLSPVRMYDMANEIGDLRIVFEIIQREMFRNGWKIVPTFKYKCGKCFKTFSNKPVSKFVPIDDKIEDSAQMTNPNETESGEQNSFGKQAMNNPAKIVPNKQKLVQFVDSMDQTNMIKKAFPSSNGNGFPFKTKDKPQQDNEDDIKIEGNPEDEQEQSEELEPLECDECGNKDPEMFYKPDSINRVKLEALMAVPANNNKMSLVDMARIYERDLDIIDNGYCLVSKRYKLKMLNEPDPDTGATMEADPEEEEISEFIPLNPSNVAKLANAEGRLGYDNQNKPVWICPQYEHRNKRLSRPVCDRCGCKAFNAVIEVNNVPYGLPVSDPKQMLYARDELIWTSGKYKPDLLYGHPLILAIWKKALSLYNQDEYMWKYFDKDRPPKSLLVFGTRNYESVQAFMERQKQGAKSDPYMPRPIMVNAENATQAAQFIDLTPNFKELELTDLRKELRQTITTLYGLSPVSTGEQKGSGLGNEGLQLTLQTRTIKYYQSILNREFFGQITKRMFHIDDWEIKLVDSEEIDELRTEQINGQKIDNASKMASMGYEHHTDGNDEFVFSQFPNPEKQAMSGGMGSNINGGKNDKVKSPNPAKEDQTQFDQETKFNRPSDKGGVAEGSPLGSGNSMSNKSLSELGEMGKAVEIINKGLVNKWTFSNMAKKIAKANDWTVDESLDVITALISQKLESNVQKAAKSEPSITRYTIEDEHGTKKVTKIDE